MHDIANRFMRKRILTDDQRRRYFEDGIVFPLPVLSAGETSEFRRAADDLEDQLGGKPRTIDVRQMHLHFPWAWSLATHPHVLDPVEDLLGPDLLIWATELFSKAPQNANVSIAWHQDKTYTRFDPRLTVSAWIALGDSNVANGCMKAVPRSRGNVDSAGEAGANARSRKPAIAAALEPQAVNVILKAGEMSLHDNEIWHGSSANGSQEKRVGFVVRFVTPDAAPAHGRPPAMLARGQDVRGHFRLVEPPDNQDAERALAAMRQSAAEHLDAVLQNLKMDGEK